MSDNEQKPASPFSKNGPPIEYEMPRRDIEIHEMSPHAQRMANWIRAREGARIARGEA